MKDSRMGRSDACFRNCSLWWAMPQPSSSGAPRPRLPVRLTTTARICGSTIQSVPAPRVVVVQDTASRKGLGSFVGEVHMNIIQALGCVGLVTDGAVRDLPAAASAGFHFFAENVTVSHAYVHIVEFGGPVEVAGLSVHSGDLLHGDLHGVQSIPLELARRIPAAAAAVAARRRAIIDVCHSPEFSLEKLREAVRNDQI